MAWITFGVISPHWQSVVAVMAAAKVFHFCQSAPCCLEQNLTYFWAADVPCLRRGRENHTSSRAYSWPAYLLYSEALMDTI